MPGGLIGTKTGRSTRESRRAVTASVGAVTAVNCLSGLTSTDFDFYN